MKNGNEMSKNEAVTALNSKTRHFVRFANFDHRLTLWVGSRLIFGDGIEYANLSDEERGPRLNRRASCQLPFGVEQAKVVVRKISLWRDIYYSRNPQFADASVSLG